MAKEHEHEHHHGHNEGCHHEHNNHEHNEECRHEHHHHEHSEKCRYEHNKECHEHGEHHHAEDVFDSWGIEQAPAISEEKLKAVLNELSDESRFGVVLRAKGMLKDKASDDWLYFDFVPNEIDIRRGDAEYTGKVCVIGANLNIEALQNCFRE